MMATILHWTFAAFLSLSLLPVISLAGPKTCVTQQGNCACETDQGLIDLSPLDSKSTNSPRFSGIPDLNIPGDVYAYNPCSAFTTTSPCTLVALCQTRPDGHIYPIGEPNPAVFVTDQNGFQITYSSPYQGVTRKSAIKLQCDRNEEGKLVSDGVDEVAILFKFTLTSKYACAPGEGWDEGGGGGLSPGSIMLIVFFSLLFVYIIGGILYNKGAKGASGTELLPNIEFWSQVPGLIKEGFIYVKRSLTKICFKDSVYDTV